MRIFNGASRAAVVTVMMLPATVFAQPPARDAAEPAPVAAEAQADTGKNEDIVVTAQRRQERLQDVPISVSAVTGKSMERAGIVDTRQLTQVVPGLTFSRANASFQPYIRGVGTRNANSGDESNVSIYIDGVYQPVMAGIGFDLVAVERVEVLRGPQGTLFGRNATGGLINIITPDPSHNLSGRLIARAGSFGERQIQGYITSGLGPVVAFDVAGSVYRDHGYIRDLVRNTSVGRKQSDLLRAKLLVEPSDAMRFLFTYTHARTDDDSSVNGQPLNGNTVARAALPLPTPFPTKPWQSALEVINLGRSKSDQLALQTRFKLPGFNIETTSATITNNALSTTDNDLTVKTIQKTIAPQSSQYMSNEIRALSTTNGPFSWIVGAFQFNGKGRFDALQTIVNGVPGAVSKTLQNVRSLAGFGEVTLKLADDHIRLTGGARYTEEHRDFSAWVNGAQTVPLQQTKFGKWTYRGSAQYRFSEEANVYASYSRGFKSGVYNGMATALSAAKPTRPETIDSFEIGAKTDLFPWLRVNASIFHYKYTDIQQSARDPITSLVVLFNAARARGNGGEIELTARATRDLTVRAYATYLDAKYTSFPGAQIFIPRTSTTPLAAATATTPALPGPCPIAGASPCGNYANPFYDASGNDMIRAPRTTFGINADYSHDIGAGAVGLSANLFHSAKYYWEFANRLTQPSYTMLNGEISWTPSRSLGLRLTAWARNLTNAVVYQQMLPSAMADGVTFERPRSYGAAASIAF
jgi:iron complex outermembrane receptor protein